MTPLQQLRRQLSELEANILRLDAEERKRALHTLRPPADSFPAGLFHCQSPYTLDYWKELVMLVGKLENQLASIPSPVSRASEDCTKAMAERIGQQFQVLYRFMQRRTQAMPPRHHQPRQQEEPAPLPDDLHGLYQRLRQQQEYERRLQDMIQSRRRQQQLEPSKASLLGKEIQQYSARLERCMHMTRRVEQRIAQLEQGWD